VSEKDRYCWNCRQWVRPETYQPASCWAGVIWMVAVLGGISSGLRYHSWLFVGLGVAGAILAWVVAGVSYAKRTFSCPICKSDRLQAAAEPTQG